ncbi:hypothetical protein EVAR_78693_1 [Eumeta japonica]|uniref:Uncharacterized protein n=1 Tax=Eumeta variegata TaxID=151549 RepID=A0A4C2AAU9_EUMVA|nr:hypothetical protein EVAR_78693_1 [Eumeta japonica]
MCELEIENGSATGTDYVQEDEGVKETSSHARVNLRSVVVDRARALATTTSMGCRSTDTRSSQNDVSIVITEYYPLGTIVQRFVFSNKRFETGPESRARPRSESKARQIGIKTTSESESVLLSSRPRRNHERGRDRSLKRSKSALKQLRNQNRVLLSSRPGPESRARPRSESKARQIGIKTTSESESGST